VPPIPNELTPARRGAPSECQSVNRVFTKNGLFAKSIFGFGASKWRLGGTCLCSRASTVSRRRSDPASSVVRSRIDQLTLTRHLFRDISYAPSDRGCKHCHPQCRLSILWNTYRTSKHVGPKLTPIAATRSSTREAQFTINRRTKHVDILKAQSLDKSHALQQGCIKINLIGWLTKKETLSFGYAKRETLTIRGEGIGNNTSRFPLHCQGTECIEIAISGSSSSAADI